MSSRQQRRLLFVLSTKEYLNNYLFTSALQDLGLDNEIRILVPEDLLDIVPAKFLECTDSLDSAVFTQDLSSFYLYTDILRWKHRKKSKSFRFREKRYANWQTTLKVLFRFRVNSKDETSELKKTYSPPSRASRVSLSWLVYRVDRLYSALKITLKYVVEISYILISQLRNWCRKYSIRTLSLRPIFKIVESQLLKKFEVPLNLKNYLVNEKFDFIIFPSSAFEPIAIHIANARHSTESTTLMIVDNWDNLSSKTILWQLPDFVATWGPQSSQHARDIQGFLPQQIFDIGSARFNNYLNLRNENISTEHAFDYVLFVGTFLEYDEIGCLLKFNEEIDENQEIYENLKIIYRPHPFSSKKNIEKLTSANNVIIDPRILLQYESDDNFLLDFDYLPTLIKNSTFIVGGLTSMLIEASIFGKNYLALVHKERFNITSPKNVYMSYTHFEGIERLPNLEFCHTTVDLRSQFRMMYLRPPNTQIEIDLQLSHFYDLDKKNFSKKLNVMIEKILTKQTSILP